MEDWHVLTHYTIKKVLGRLDKSSWHEEADLFRTGFIGKTRDPVLAKCSLVVFTFYITGLTRGKRS